jgi:hypothetical protein
VYGLSDIDYCWYLVLYVPNIATFFSTIGATNTEADCAAHSETFASADLSANKKAH